MNSFFSGDEGKAKDMLARALLRFPTMLKPLLEKIAASTSSGSWLPVLSSRVFANARSISGEGSVLQHLLDIYVTRNASVWKVNDVQMFLLRSAQHALASPELVVANPQVLALPACLDKYMRALPNGTLLSSGGGSIQPSLPFNRLMDGMKPQITRMRSRHCRQIIR